MKRSSVPTVVLVAAAALVALLVYGVIERQAGVGSDALDKKVSQGKLPVAPKRDLARPQLDAKTERRIADLEGQVVVVNFFASWCVPCETEAPVLAKIQDRLEQDKAGTVIGVTYHDAPDAARKFGRDNGLTFPILSDPGDSLFEAYGNRGIPETFVLDKRGQIVDLRRGQIDQTFIDQAVKRARAAT